MVASQDDIDYLRTYIKIHIEIPNSGVYKFDSV